MLRVGLIADTHNLLRPEAQAFLEGCDHIVHAGDIANAETLAQIAAIAPLTVVRGNNDQGEWAEALPETARVTLAGVTLYVIHDVKELTEDPAALGAQILIYGHSHKPFVEQRGAVLHVNPGSAGRRRFKLPVTLAELRIDGPRHSVRVVNLQ